MYDVSIRLVLILNLLVVLPLTSKPPLT